MTYLWFKAIHVICVVAWFAELFYIFRLFVYHVKHKEVPKLPEIYSTMEYKLIYYIGHPSMLGTLFFGIGMIWMNPLLLKQGWLHAKLLGVAVVMGYQFLAGRTRARFAKGDYFLSEKACRIINEVPTLVLIAAVILVILKPF